MNGCVGVHSGGPRCPRLRGICAPTYADHTVAICPRIVRVCIDTSSLVQIGSQPPLCKHPGRHAFYIRDRNSSRNWCQVWWHFGSPKIKGRNNHLITMQTGCCSRIGKRSGNSLLVSASQSSFILTTTPLQPLLVLDSPFFDQLIRFDLIPKGHDFYRELVQFLFLVSRIST